MTKTHCCSTMAGQIDHRCAEHVNPFDCPDALVFYEPRFDEYGIIIHDGGTSVQLIHYCPWCGTALPVSKRDRWFDQLAVLGFDDPTVQAIPTAFLVMPGIDQTSAMTNRHQTSVRLSSQLQLSACHPRRLRIGIRSILSASRFSDFPRSTVGI